MVFHLLWGCLEPNNNNRGTTLLSPVAEQGAGTGNILVRNVNFASRVRERFSSSGDPCVDTSIAAVSESAARWCWNLMIFYVFRLQVKHDVRVVRNQEPAQLSCVHFLKPLCFPHLSDILERKNMKFWFWLEESVTLQLSRTEKLWTMQCVNKSKPTINYPECPSAWNYQTAARDEIKPQFPPLADYLLLLLVYGRTFIISIVLSENLFLFSASAEALAALNQPFFKNFLL